MKCPTRSGKRLINPGARVCQECRGRYTCERLTRLGKGDISVLDFYHFGHGHYIGSAPRGGALPETPDSTG